VAISEKKTLLLVDNVSRHFGSLAAVDQLSFEVKAGDVFGIAGPNGSGKTTLMNIITQVIPPTGGRIFFKGIPIYKKSASEICHLGIARTFQKPTVFETMTVLDNLRIGATFGRGHGRIKINIEEIQAILDFVGYTLPMDRIAGSLIINDRKKIMMAIALSAKPLLLILDEPCAGLNTLEYKETISLIHQIADKGTTVMLIEHNMKVLMNISDKVLIMDHGTKLCLGSPDEVCSNKQVIEKYLGNAGAKRGEVSC